MKRFIIFSYLLFCIFSVIFVEKCMLYLFISILLYIPIKKQISKLSYEELEDMFFISFFRNKFPDFPLFR